MYEIVCMDIMDWADEYAGPPFHAILTMEGEITFRSEVWEVLGQHLHPGAFVLISAPSRGEHRAAFVLEEAGYVLQPSIFIQGPGPRLEPIIVAQWPWGRKRLDDIVQTGAGAMWVDGGRIAGAIGNGIWGSSQEGSSPGQHGTMGKGWDNDHRTQQHPQGRWPSNFALVHHPECRPVGTQQVRPLEGHRPNPVSQQADGRIEFNRKPSGYQKISYTDPDGYETVTAWECVPECPVRRLGEQSGEREVSGTAKLGKQNRAGRAFFGNCEQGYTSKMPNDNGTASRFYFQADWLETEAGRVAHCPTDKPIALTRWLATLLLPPELYAPRRILVPFLGTGNVGVGALLAGWEDVIGIGLDAACTGGTTQVETLWGPQALTVTANSRGC